MEEGTALRGSFLPQSPLGFETKLPQSTFPLPDHLPELLAQAEAPLATWLWLPALVARLLSGRGTSLQTLLFKILY